LEPYRNNKKVMKKLFRPREKTQEKTRNMNFTKDMEWKEKEERNICDYSEKDNTMVFYPDFRSYSSNKSSNN
jgi:hypothetical protein